MRLKKILFWIIAFILTLSVAVYQRMTGPTYPVDYDFSVENTVYSLELPRSQNGTKDAMVLLEIQDAGINAKMYYKRFNTADSWDTLKFDRENDKLIAWLPGQPPAGKLEYRLEIFSAAGEVVFETPESVVIRFKDEVPAFVLIPHIILIFSAMLMSTLTGFYAMAGMPRYKLFTLITLLLFLSGGMIMGPVVQKYAFGEYWTGFPFGKDLTDNKALIAFIFWIIAFAGNRKNKERRYLVIIAFAINLIISLIPHSLMGSELDYETGEIETGMIFLSSLL